MNYFGTDLDTHGHYTWDISGDRMIKVGLLPRNTPFNPEELTNGLAMGSVCFYQGGGFTALGIAGGCVDTRRGVKSVFWVKGIFDYWIMVDMILGNEIAKKIVHGMKFQVMWAEVIPSRDADKADSEGVVEVKVAQDSDSHWYVIPSSMYAKFLIDNADEQMAESGEFDQEYGSYRTGGDINNIKLYVKK